MSITTIIIISLFPYLFMGIIVARISIYLEPHIRKMDSYIVLVVVLWPIKILNFALSKVIFPIIVYIFKPITKLIKS